MYDASTTAGGGTITCENPTRTAATVDAVQSDASALWPAYEGDAAAITADDTRARPERRRPGRRIANTSEALIPLLRVDGQLLQDGAATLADDRDDMAPANGILAGLLISGVFWLGIFLLLH